MWCVGVGVRADMDFSVSDHSPTIYSIIILIIINIMNNPKLIVSNIIGTDVNGYSRVTISNELFNAVRGFKPLLPFEDRFDENGERIRVFNIDGVELYASYDKTTSKTMFVLKTTEAQKHFVPLAQQRANGPKSPFTASAFDRTVIKANATA